MKLPRDRIAYSAIVDRPPLKLPDGARIAVWTIVNVEEWSIERNMAAASAQRGAPAPVPRVMPAVVPVTTAT